MPDVATDRLWTVHEAAAYLQLPVSAIYKMTAPKGRLRMPHVRIAGRLRFRRVDLDAWLELLTVSNCDVLRKTRQLSRKVSRGDDSQTEVGQR